MTKVGIERFNGVERVQKMGLTGIERSTTENENGTEKSQAEYVRGDTLRTSRLANQDLLVPKIGLATLSWLDRKAGRARGVEQWARE